MDLIIKPTEKCNFKCTFCSSTSISDDHAQLLDLNTVFEFLFKYPETKTIIVNGGDPLVVDPLYYWKLIEFLDDNNMSTNISLTTNLWPFYIKPDKWIDLFRHPRVGVATSFQYGEGRLKGDYSVFTEEDFWNVSNKFLELVGYRPSFIAVITEENQDTVLDTVRLAQKMGVVCKVNYAMASGIQSKPYRLSKIYERYLEVHEAGLTAWEHNTQIMTKRLIGSLSPCPQNRKCDEGIRAFNPGGDLYSCGSLGDDRDYEITLEDQKPLQNKPELQSLKQACFTCPMFDICNGCRKTILDLKRHGMVEDHCYHMKQLAPRIIQANMIEREVTPYVNEAPDIIAKS